MFARKKTKPTGSAYDLPLSLHASDGTLLHNFPAEVVVSMRHMESTLAYSKQLPDRIAIVSALSGEGVTYTALALAVTLATDLPLRVCVVELNWHTPGLLTRLSRPTIAAPRRRRWRKPIAPEIAIPSSLVGRAGLAQLLTNAATLDEVLMPTAIPNLMLLPAGDLPQHQRAAMARSDTLKQYIQELGQRFDHLILDIPAIQSTTDAVPLASLARGCCVVIRQGVTPASSVRNALDDLKHLPMLGVILNQAYTNLPRWLQPLVPNE
jgi:Mrp family chromosome partitioning ATPase